MENGPVQTSGSTAQRRKRTERFQHTEVKPADGNMLQQAAGEPRQDSLSLLPESTDVQPELPAPEMDPAQQTAAFRGIRPEPGPQIPRQDRGNRPGPGPQMPRQERENRPGPGSQMPRQERENRPGPGSQMPRQDWGNRPGPGPQMPRQDWGNRPGPWPQMPPQGRGNRLCPGPQMPPPYRGPLPPPDGRPRGRKKKAIRIILPILLVLILAAGAFAVWRYTDWFGPKGNTSGSSRGQVLFLSFESGFGNPAGSDTAVVHGDTSFSEGINGGTGIILDGRGDYIELGKGCQIAGGLSVNLWARPENGEQKEAALFAKGLNEEGSYRILLKNNRPTVIVAAGDNDLKEYSSSLAIGDGEWHMITCVFAGNEMILFVDGNEQGSIALPETIRQNNSPVTVGRLSGSPDPDGLMEYEGYMDELTVYNRPLSREEIAALYHGTTP